MKFTYLDIHPWTDECAILDRTFNQAKTLMKATWYWWDWEKAQIRERVACERLTIILAVAEMFSKNNWSMGVIAQRLGMKQPTLRKWLKSFRTGGIEGLKPKRQGLGLV